MFGQQVLNGLSVGLVYGLLAIGLVMIFSATRIVNFAHGEIFSLGAFVGFERTFSTVGIIKKMITGTLGHVGPFKVSWRAVFYDNTVRLRLTAAAGNAGNTAHF